MYLQIKTYSIILILSIFCLSTINAQNETLNTKSIEIGLIGAGDEALYFGAYGKFTMPLSQKQQHFTIGASLTSYFDFKGESTSEAYLNNDVDMRVLPSVIPGYSFNFSKFQINLEIPIGLSIAYTKGTLVNEKIGFEQTYSNTDTFFSYGIALAPKYSINQKNLIGLYGFLPLISDKAQSGFQFGINWTIVLGK